MANAEFDGKDRSSGEDNIRKRFRLGLALFAAYLLYWIAVQKLAPPIIVAQIYFPFASFGRDWSPFTVGAIEVFPLLTTLVVLQIFGILQRNILSWLVWISIAGVLSSAAHTMIDIFGLR